MSWPRVGVAVPAEPEPSFEAQAEAARKQAQEEGYAAGFAAGEAHFDEELGRALASVAELYQALQAHKLALAAEELDGLVQVLKSAFSGILGATLPGSDETLSRYLQQGIDALYGVENLQVRAHPDLCERIQALAPELELNGDAALPEYGLALETAHGGWQADPNAEFARLAQELIVQTQPDVEA